MRDEGERLISGPFGPSEERLVERGAYHYELNGAPAGISEPWTLSRRGDGAEILRARREAPSHGLQIVVEAIRVGGAISRFTVAFSASRGMVREAVASYAVDGRAVHISRRLDGVALPPETVESASPPVIAPLMRIFQGPAILEVAARGPGEAVPVFVPRIDRPGDPDVLLRGAFDLRRAFPLDPEPSAPAETRRYRYLANVYDEEACFWLDARGLLVRYRFQESQQASWEVTLTGHEQVQPGEG